jgi:hypothetical protein
VHHDRTKMNQPLSRKMEARSAIIHRTVWCATRLSDVPPDCPVSQQSNGSLRQRSTLQSAIMKNSVAQKSEQRSQRGTGLSGATRGQSLQQSTSSRPYRLGDVACHTRFWKANRMGTMYVLGSELTYTTVT